MKNFLKTPGYQHRSHEVRLEWLRSRDAMDAEQHAIVQDMAINDEHASVRETAIGLVEDLQVLRALAEKRDDDAGRSSSQVAIDRLRQLIGLGHVSDIALRALMSSLPDALAGFTALNAASAEQRQLAIGLIGDESTLVQVALESPIHQDRESAAARIETVDTLQSLLAAIRDRDKVVARQIQERLDAVARAEAEKQEVERQIGQTLDSLEGLGRSVWSPQSAGRFAALKERWQGLPVNEREPLESRFAAAVDRVDSLLAEHRRQVEDEKDRMGAELHSPANREAPSSLPGDGNASSAEHASTRDGSSEMPDAEGAESASTAVPVIDPAILERAGALLEDTQFASDWERSNRVTLEELPGWMEALGEHPEDATLKAYAHSVAVLFDPPFETRKARPDALRDRIARIDRLVDVAAVSPLLANDVLNLGEHAWMRELAEHQAELNARLPQAEQESDDRIRATRSQFDALDGHIRDGKWSAANNLFKRVQKKIQAMEPGERKQLDQRFVALEKQLSEMADWQDFAARPKLTALCEEMEQLAEGTHEPRDLAKRVRDIQKRWKALGVSRASNELWSRFHAAGDAAYLPYQNWLALKEQERNCKAEVRKAILEKLEAERSSIDDATDAGSLRKLVNRSLRDWKATQVHGVRADGALEKRYTQAITPFRERLAALQKDSQTEKEALIAKAEALAAGEINAHAVNQARNLFAAWKQSGQADRKIDGKLWQTFKGHIDAVYDKKRDQDKQRRQSDNAHVDRARAIIGELRSLARESTPDDARVQALSDEFRGLEKFPDAARKRLLSDFNKAVDACAASRSKEDARREQASRDELYRLLGLCEEVETAVETGSAPESLGDDLLERWNDTASVSPARETLALLEHRRDVALEHLANGTQPDYASAEEVRRELLVRMEVAAGVDTPEDDKGRRMQYQLAHLQEGMMSAGNGDARSTLEALELEWIAAPPASLSVRDALGSRYLRVMEG